MSRPAHTSRWARGLGLLGAVAAVSCTPGYGERASGERWGDDPCAKELKCSDKTPYGVKFDSLLSSGGLFGGVGSTLAVGGTLTVTASPAPDPKKGGPVAAMPAFEASSSDDTVISLLSVDQPSFRLEGHQAGSATISLFEPGTDLLLDRLTIPVSQAASIVIAPQEPLSFAHQAAVFPLLPAAVVGNDPVRWEARVLDSADTTLLSEDGVFDPLGDSPGGLSSIYTTVPPPGAVEEVSIRFASVGLQGSTTLPVFDGVDDFEVSLVDTSSLYGGTTELSRVDLSPTTVPTVTSSRLTCIRALTHGHWAANALIEVRLQPEPLEDDRVYRGFACDAYELPPGTWELEVTSGGFSRTYRYVQAGK